MIASVLPLAGNQPTREQVAGPVNGREGAFDGVSRLSGVAPLLPDATETTQEVVKVSQRAELTRTLK